MAKIAFLGTGAMGSAMIKNYLKGGHQVTAYNRTIEKVRPLESLGAKAAETPKEAVEGADIIISSLMNVDACRATWTGVNGALSGNFNPDAYAIEASTSTVDWIHELKGLTEEKGLRFLDCPVAGRPEAANAGTLRIYAGGAKEDVDALRPVLEAISSTVTHFGPVGSGLTFKLIYNIMGACQVAATAEGLAACEAAGIDLRAAAGGFAAGMTGSPHVLLHSKNMSEDIREEPISFAGKNRVKDTDYGIKIIENLGAQSILGHATKKVWQQMEEHDMGDLNDSQLIDALRAAMKQRKGS